MAYGKGTWRNGYKPLQSDLDALKRGEWPDNYQPTQEEYNDYHGKLHQASSNAADKGTTVAAQEEAKAEADEKTALAKEEAAKKAEEEAAAAKLKADQEAAQL